MTSRPQTTRRQSYAPFSCLALMLISLISSCSSSSSSGCPSPCSCSTDQSGRPLIINCSNRNLNRVLTNLPTDVVELDLSVNNIVNVSQSSFSSLTSLQKLSMGNCLLERLERNTFRNLQLLEVLQLSRNRIQFIDDKAFAGLSSLRTLDLSLNELDVLPGYIFRGLSLESLQLDGNRIESIPDEAFQGTRVSFLNLNENRMLRLNRSNLRPLEESLTRLSVSQNKRPLTVEGDAFAGFRFTSLSIVSSNLSDVLFLVHVHTQTLDISSNSFPRNVLFPRSTQLADSCETLHISNSNLHEFSEDLAFSLRRVKSIDLSGNRLRDINSVALFRFTPELLTLNLSWNNFAETFFSDDFSAALGRLRTLDLSHSGITLINPQMFRSADQLERVDLSFNRLQIITEDAAQYLDKISTVDLTGNPLHCNCEMLWFRKWLSSSSQGTNVGSVKCATPILFTETATGDVNSGIQNDDIVSRRESDFLCTEPIMRISSNQNLDEGTSFTLSCTSQSDPAADIVWTLNSKESIRITPDKDRTRTLTDAPLQLSRLRSHQTGWYACSASNLLAETVRYIYIHVVTSSIPPADVTYLAYPEVPEPLKPQRPTNQSSTTISSPVTDRSVPPVMDAIPTYPMLKTAEFFPENSTESFLDTNINSTMVITEIEEEMPGSASVLTAEVTATEVSSRTTTTTTTTTHIPTTTSTSPPTPGRFTFPASVPLIPATATKQSTTSTTSLTTLTTTTTTATSTTTPISLLNSTLPIPGAVLTAAANDANYETTKAAVMYEGNKLLWIIIISTLSTLVLLGIGLIGVCVYCCRRNRQNQYYGDLPVKTNTRSRRTATGEKRRVFKTPPDIDSIPLNDRMTRCTDLTM